MRDLGFNYRLTDIQWALGKSQLTKLEAWVERRRAIMQRYREGLANVESCVLLPEPPRQRASYHLAVVRMRGEKPSQRRRRLYDFLISQNIGVQVHYMPVYRQPVYRERFKYESEDFPNAESFYKSCLSLPMFPKMSDADVERVIAEVSRAKI